MRFPISKNAVVPSAGPPPLPPILQQAGNYIRAQAIATKRAATGKDVYRSRAEAVRLIETHCKGHGDGKICSSYRFVDQKCSECGCPVLRRAAREGLGCPKGKF